MEDDTPKEFRCTRNEPYDNPECFGHTDLRCRQGHYIVARTKVGALREMHRTFPHDGPSALRGMLFTADVWKTGDNVPSTLPVEDRPVEDGVTTIVSFNADDADYLGNEEDGVYFQTAEGPDGWYVTAVVDCDSAGFVSDLTTDDGPYASEAEANMGGRNAATDWCLTNGISWEN